MKEIILDNLEIAMEHAAFSGFKRKEQVVAIIFPTGTVMDIVFKELWTNIMFIDKDAIKHMTKTRIELCNGSTYILTSPDQRISPHLGHSYDKVFSLSGRSSKELMFMLIPHMKKDGAIYHIGKEPNVSEIEKPKVMEEIHITLPFDIQPDVPDRNGRIFPKKVLDKMLKDYMNTKHNNFVYLGIPSIYPMDELGRLPPVSFESAAGVVESITDYEFKIKLLSTINGNIVKELVHKDNIPISVSSSHTGSIEDNKVLSGAQIRRLAITKLI